LFPEAPPDDLLPSCSEAGVLGVLPGLIGSLQANEVIKIIVGIGQPLSGQLLIYDALESAQKILKFGNSMNEHVEEPSATQSQVMFHEIDSANAIAKMNQGWSPYFIDVRSQQENSDARIAKAVDLCPHTEILTAIDRIPKDVDVLVHCRSGMRSQLAIMQLIEAGYDGAKMYNLSGGIIGWAEVDPEGIIQG
jgi:rhodanese-related sulfurtransferase